MGRNLDEIIDPASKENLYK